MNNTFKLTHAQELTAAILKANKAELDDVNRRVKNSVEKAYGKKNEKLNKSLGHVEHVLASVDDTLTMLFDFGIQSGMFKEGQTKREFAADAIILANILPIMHVLILSHAHGLDAECEVAEGVIEMTEHMQEDINELGSVYVTLQKLKGLDLSVSSVSEVATCFANVWKEKLAP